MKQILKHLPGQHNQKLHGARYSSISQIKRSLTALEGDEISKAKYRREWDMRKRKLQPELPGLETPKKPLEAYMKGKPVSGLPRGMAPNGAVEISEDAKKYLGALAPDNFTFTHGLTQLTTDDRIAYKVEVMNKLVANTELDETMARQFVKQWAQSSNNNHYGSMLTQQVASELFGVELSEFQKGKLPSVEQEHTAGYNLSSFEVGTNKMAMGASAYKTPRDATKAAVKAMYDQTQKELAEHGIKTMTVYRGINLAGKNLPEGTVVNVDGNALESWTLNPKTALRFAGGGTVLKMNVPAERIHSTIRTGFGASIEAEVVVIGGKNMGEAMVMRHIDIREYVGE